MSRRNKDRVNQNPSRQPSTSSDVEATSLGGPDIRQLRDGSLPEAPFPGGRDQDFRVCFAPEVHPTLWSHATADTSVEICGVLVGRWGRDADGPFVAILGSVQGDAAENKFAEVTFTHQTWAKINAEMDRSYPDLTIVGWYHTHPDFGVFLSDRDVFIQQNFFSEAGHIAHVIDPIRRTEGVFVWKNGKPSLTPHFWVGPNLKTSTDAGSESTPAAPSNATEVGASSRPTAGVGPWLPPTERLLAYLALLLFGYLLASARTSWNETRLSEGTVAHYGIWQGLRPGLGEKVDQVSDRLRYVSRQLDVFSADYRKRLGKAEDVKAAEKEWGAVRGLLAESSEMLDKLKATYELSPTESILVQEQILRKLIELREPPPPPRASEGSKADPKKEAPAPATKPIPEPSGKAPGDALKKPPGA